MMGVYPPHVPDSVKSYKTPRRRLRYGVIVWKLPLVMLPLLPIALLLELATTLTWFAYCVADKSSDRFKEFWLSLNSRLPDHWHPRTRNQ